VNSFSVFSCGTHISTNQEKIISANPVGVLADLTLGSTDSILPNDLIASLVTYSMSNACTSPDLCTLNTSTYLSTPTQLPLSPSLVSAYPMPSSLPSPDKTCLLNLTSPSETPAQLPYQVSFYTQPVINWATVTATVAISEADVCQVYPCTLVDVVPVNESKVTTAYDAVKKQVNVTLL
jgi:hypothetical protein